MCFAISRSNSGSRLSKLNNCFPAAVLILGSLQTNHRSDARGKSSVDFVSYGLNGKFGKCEQTVTQCDMMCNLLGKCER